MTTRPLHPSTVPLTVLLRGGKAGDGEWQSNVAAALMLMFEPMCDEQKADLYALIVEKYDPESGFIEQSKVISHCLWHNLNHWAPR
jgi:hypothetical protein